MNFVLYVVTDWRDVGVRMENSTLQEKYSILKDSQIPPGIEITLLIIMFEKRYLHYNFIMIKMQHLNTNFRMSHFHHKT